MSSVSIFMSRRRVLIQTISEMTPYLGERREPHTGVSIEISGDWASEASPTLGCSIEISRDIGECGSTLYVGLSRIVRNRIQKSTVWDHTFLSIFFFFFFLGMSRAGVNTKDAMKKQIRRIHSVFSHVDP